MIGYCVGPTESDSLSHNRHNNNTPNHERARKIDMHGIIYQKYGAEKIKAIRRSFHSSITFNSFFFSPSPDRLDHVAREAIPILLNATSGSLWLVMNDEKPREIAYSSEVF